MPDCCPHCVRTAVLRLGDARCPACDDARRARAVAADPDMVAEALIRAALDLGVPAARMRAAEYAALARRRTDLPSLAVVLGMFETWRAARAAVSHLVVELP